MTWARIDVEIEDHPKLAGLSEAQVYAFIKVILWCQKHDTAGVIAATVPARTFTRHAPEKAWRLFLERGLVVEQSDGSRLVPNLATFQETIRQRKKRAGWRDAKAKQRGSESQNDENVPQDVLAMSSDNVTGRNETGPDEKTPPPSSSSSVRPKKHAGRQTNARELAPLTAADFATALPAQEEEDRPRDIALDLDESDLPW